MVTVRTLRIRELLLLGLAAVAATAAYLTVHITRTDIVDTRATMVGVIFFGLFLMAHVAIRRYAPLADPYLLPAVALLSGIGIAMIYRLSPDRALRQSFWLMVAIGGLIALLALLPSHRLLEKYRYVIGLVGVLLLAITVSPLGTEINGSQLWIKVGSLQVQPGEFAKLLIVIFLAAYLREHREMLRRGVTIRHVGPLLLFWAASLVLLVLMRDFGTSLLFYGTFLLMVWVAVGRPAYVLTGLGLFIGGAVAVWRVVPHVQDRFDIWLEPWADPQGLGYQPVQGLFALADGGVFGKGLGNAYLVTESGQTIIPDAETDFIFAAIGNEMGLVGAVGLLLVYAVIVWRGFSIAEQCRNGFSKLLAYGLTATFALQTVIIIGGVVRLLPLTGQTLPFVSYGGSSVLANFLLVGLLLGISSSVRAQHGRVAAADRAPQPLATGGAT